MSRKSAYEWGCMDGDCVAPFATREKAEARIAAVSDTAPSEDWNFDSACPWCDQDNRGRDFSEEAHAARHRPTPSEDEQLPCQLPGHAGCERVLVDGEPWFDHHPTPVDREKLIEEVAQGMYCEAMSGRDWMLAPEDVRQHWRRYARVALDAALAVSPAPARDEWEYEYADDDDPEGNVYGQLRRIVGPWLPVTEEER